MVQEFSLPYSPVVRIIQWIYAMRDRMLKRKERRKYNYFLIH